MVLTLTGFGPVLPACLFRFTAERFCDLLILAALAAGTHFGYLRFEVFAFLRPHG